MPITTVIIISLLLANLALTLIMFWTIYDLLGAAKSLRYMEDDLNKALYRNNQLIEQYDKCLDGVYKRETAMHDTIMSWCENAEKTYDSIKEAYHKMFEQYKTICDMHTKLLNCWKGCEERYSQSYELFKHCSDNLKEVSYQLTDLANVSTEDEYTLTLNEACDTVCLDCPYKKCQTEVCPVYEIKSKQNKTETASVLDDEMSYELKSWKSPNEGGDTVEWDE